MLIKLSILYFIYNNNRMMRAIKLISIGLIIISSSNILISSFTEQVSTVTTSYYNENLFLLIQPKNENYFTDTQYNQLTDILELLPIDGNLSESEGIANLVLGNISQLITLHIVDMDILNNNLGLKENFNYNSSGVYVTNELLIKYNLKIGNYYIIQYNSTDHVISPIRRIYSSLNYINSGIYMDYRELSNYPFNSTINRIQIKAIDSESVSVIYNRLKNINYLNIIHTRPEAEFMRSSANQINNILLLLQFVISIIVVMSISNLFFLFLYESRYDIRILLSIGYTINQVRALFLLISLFIGIITGIFTYIFSVILITSIFSAMAIFFDFVYIAPTFDPSLIKSLILYGVLISVISSIFPIKKEIKLT